MNDANTGFGVEDSNESNQFASRPSPAPESSLMPAGAWKFDSKISDRGFRSDDVITMAVDFNADTFDMWRNRGVGGKSEAHFHVDGIPFPTVHFAITLWSKGCSAEILSSFSDYSDPPVQTES